MAPKSNDKNSGPTAFEARVAACHTYLLKTCTAHTLKDLEKSLPAAVSGVSGMNAKDHIQALVDENLLRVEKIGTGNWYWCFGSDDRLQRDRVKQQATAEADTIKSRVENLHAELDAEKTTRAQDGDAPEALIERQKLADEVAQLRITVAELNHELAKYEDGDPTILEAKKVRSRKLRDAAETWTENCWVLEGWMRDNLGLQKEDSLRLLKECYGNEFVEEDGGLTEVA